MYIHDTYIYIYMYVHDTTRYGIAGQCESRLHVGSRHHFGSRFEDLIQDTILDPPIVVCVPVKDSELHPQNGVRMGCNMGLNTMRRLIMRRQMVLSVHMYIYVCHTHHTPLSLSDTHTHTRHLRTHLSISSVWSHPGYPAFLANPKTHTAPFPPAPSPHLEHERHRHSHQLGRSQFRPPETEYARVSRL